MIEENPIDKDKTADNPGLIPFAHHVGSAVIKPTDMGKVKSRALLAMEQQTHLQMKQIYEQIEKLAEQANKIKKRVEVSNEIYGCVMGFEPVIGHLYHLYEKEDGVKILSMIGPNEWGKSFPFKSHLASVRMLGDHTWEVLENELD
jgi:hypothetical protein